jgi:hypothetical protein
MTPSNLKLLLLLMPLAFLFAGCSSSGNNQYLVGGLGGYSSLSALPKQTYNSTTPGQSYYIPGTAHGVGYTYSGATTSGNETVPVANIGMLPPGSGSSTIGISVATGETDSTGNTSILSIRLPDLATGYPYQYDNPNLNPNQTNYISGQSSSPMVTTYGYSTTNSSTSATGGTLERVSAANTPGGAQNFNYMFYGEWNVINSDTTSGFDGFFVTGVPSTSLPATGSASYAGDAIGKYIDGSGNVYQTAATMNSTANFGSSPTLSFSTTNTVMQQVGSSTATSNPNLNLSGTLAISGVGFTGTVTSSTSSPSPLGLSGMASGVFYGPGITSATTNSVVGSPPEIGGTYQLSGATTATSGRMVGAFGGVVQ